MRSQILGSRLASFASKAERPAENETVRPMNSEKVTYVTHGYFLGQEANSPGLDFEAR